MNNILNNKPHGGSLVNLLADENRCMDLKNTAIDLPEIILNDRQICDFELLTTGIFSPLTGFMTSADYHSVLEKMRLKNGIVWPHPVCLDISETTAKSLEIGKMVTLRDPEGFLLALMHIEDIWPIDREKEASFVFNTNDPAHPGIHYLFNIAGDYYIGGRIEAVSTPIHFDFKQLRLTPEEVRNIFKKFGWQRVVSFQTRHPVHRPTFEMTVNAMRQAKANLLLLPVVGTTKPGDFDHYTRVRCYREITRNYPPDSFVLNLLPLAMRLAGPRDAVLQSIIAKNYGCSHFIIGHDHASPGNDSSGKPYYKSHAARTLATDLSEEIGVEIIPFKEMVYLPIEDEFRSVDQVPEGTQTIALSGTDIRNRIMEGKRIHDWSTFPEVVAEIRKAYPPPRRQGATIFMTGLSGSGKSTIAKVLYSRFLEIGDRPVTLLDGDIVRRNLSSELNFSKEHRDINVRRIGFVASEITKNRGIAICAPIAPYTLTRREIRETIEEYGGFIEVHVATPIEECEKRDRKGMYAKARAGIIKGFTGIDDPYEIPEKPEVRIDTTNLTPDEAAQEILLLMGQKGYI